jgi:hypothetical protein
MDAFVYGSISVSSLGLLCTRLQQALVPHYSS